MTVWEKRLPGIGLCLAIALVAWFVVELLPVLEVMGSAVLAILIGMVGCAVIKNRAAVREGVKDGVAFTSKKVLQYAVILLGFGLNLRQIGQVGLTSPAHHPVHHLHRPDRGLPACPRRCTCRERPPRSSGWGPPSAAARPLPPPPR